MRKAFMEKKNAKSRGLGDSLMETKQKTQETKEKPKEPKKTVDQRSWGWGVQPGVSKYCI